MPSVNKSLFSVTERQWQNQVEKLASAYGWKYYHAPDNRPVNGRIQRVVAGFPDLVLVKNGVLVFAELKREKGLVSAEQTEWLRELALCGHKVFVWRPSNLNEVLSVLQQ